MAARWAALLVAASALLAPVLLLPPQDLVVQAWVAALGLEVREVWEVRAEAVVLRHQEEEQEGMVQAPIVHLLQARHLRARAE